jgi:flagellar motor component MotA
MSFLLYILGILVVLGGVIYGAILLNVPQQWIVVSSIIIVGLGILSAVAHTRSRDKAQ